MNLVYQLEDKLFWIHNFLPQSFYKDLHNLVFKGHKKVSQDSSKVWIVTGKQLCIQNNLSSN